METSGLKNKIEEFLDKNKRSLEYMESLFSIDDNRDRAEEFYKEDKLKVLCVYLSPATTRAVSNTHNALVSLIKKTNEEDIVVDSCYFPEDGNLEVFKSNGIPYIFGSATHEPIGFFDCVLVSNAVSPEVLNIPRFWLNTGIGMTIQERDKQDIPNLFFGGAIANETSIVLGPVKDNSGKDIGKSLVDVCMYGYGEKTLPGLGEALLKYKCEGLNLRDRKSIRERLINDKVLHDYLFFPEYYEWDYKDDNFTLNEIKCLDERLPKQVKFGRIELNEDMGWNRKVFNLSGDNADSHDIQISSGCSGSGNCSFCEEATVAGGYRELPLDQVENLMKKTVRNCAPNTLSYFSYNLNYYYRFMDLLATGGNYFSGVTLLNERLDIIANAPEQMKLAKRLGLKRVSAPVEGAGEKIRQGLLNKNLDRKTLMRANHVISDLSLMHMKFGMIKTGYETEEDFKDFISEIDEMIKIRDEHGSNHSYQCNWTPLVLYRNIALCYLERRTAKQSYLGTKDMGYIIEEMKKRGIRNKMNGKGCGTWLEQLILDFGPAGTDWMVHLVNDHDLGYVRFFGDKVKDAATEELTKRRYDPLFFCDARPLDWVFPCDNVKCIPDALQNDWKKRTQLWNEGNRMAFDKRLCLRTKANMEAHCSGCGMCEGDKDAITYMNKRDIYDEHNYEQVAEILSESRLQKSVRVVVKMKPEWFFYNRTSLAHYITSRFLQANENIAEQFYSVGKTTTTWLSNNGQKGWFGGTWCYDINLRSRVSIHEFESVLDKVSSVLESCQILRVIDDTKDVSVKRDTQISYIGSTSIWSLSQIKDKLSMFDWDIKIPIKSMGGQLDTETKHMPELHDKVLFAQKGQSVIIGMDLPASVSPYMVMSSILGKGYEKMLADFKFDIIDQTADTDMVDNKGQHIGYSYFTGKYNSSANIETIRKYLYALTH